VSGSAFTGAERIEIIRELLGKQNWRCAYCRGRLRLHRATVDHVMPRRVGGSDERENLLAVCKPCNEQKGGDLPSLEFHEAIRRRVHYGAAKETAR
jgi:5-methylcytosine-specific restriction endonuclease McrA